MDTIGKKKNSLAIDQTNPQPLEHSGCSPKVSTGPSQIQEAGKKPPWCFRLSLFTGISSLQLRPSPQNLAPTASSSPLSQRKGIWKIISNEGIRDFNMLNLTDKLVFKNKHPPGKGNAEPSEWDCKLHGTQRWGFTFREKSSCHASERQVA